MIPGLPAALAGGLLAGLLTRRLCADRAAAPIAALAYGLSPSTLAAAQASTGGAALAAGLPLLLILFYRVNDSVEGAWRAALPLAAGLALLGAAHPYSAVAGGTMLWLIFLCGYALDSRRASEVWGPAFWRLGAATVEGVLLYGPVWWARARVGGPPTLALPDAGMPTAVGPIAGALGVLALLLSRSYRSQARLWGWVCALLFWLSLGRELSWGGRPLWWIPCLYRGAERLPWLGDPPPALYGAAGGLALALLCAFGASALLARLPPWRLLWTRLAAAVSIAAVLAADLLRG